MSEADDMWRRVYEGFAYQSDLTPQAALNRIAAKCLKLGQPQSFDPSNCTVHEERLSLDELRQLKRYHGRDRPRRDGGSIVVLSYQGERFVLDGHNRISKWLKEESTELRAVIIIELREPKGAIVAEVERGSFH